MRNYDVYISYSHEESDWATNLRIILHNNGIRCFMSSDETKRGYEYATAANAALRECPIFLIVLSSETQTSKWVTKELNEAINYNKIIFPIIIEEFSLNEEYNFLLAQTQRFTVFSKNDSALDKLLNVIKATLNKPVTNQTPKNRNNLKTIIVSIAAILTAIAVAIGVISYSLSDTDTGTPTHTVIDQDTAAPKGETGDCTWEYDQKSKTLTISGNGATGDYNLYDQHQPWSAYCEEIETVNIKKGVGVINNGAFKYCSKIKTVVIPDSVTEIGSNAFYLCSSIKEVHLPDSVTTIGNKAFSNCGSLQSVTIPQSVSKIGHNAFYSCHNICIHCQKGSYTESYCKENIVTYKSY